MRMRDPQRMGIFCLLGVASAVGDASDDTDAAAETTGVAVDVVTAMPDADTGVASFPPAAGVRFEAKQNNRNMFWCWSEKPAKLMDFPSRNLRDHT